MVFVFGEIGGEEVYKFLLENRDKFLVLIKNIIVNFLEKIKGRMEREEGNVFEK